MQRHDGLEAFDAHWDYADPSGTEAKFSEILHENRRAPLAYRAELQTQMARCQGLQREFEAAHETLNRTEEQLNAAGLQTPGLEVARVRLLLERGRALRSNDQEAESSPLFEQAYAAAQACGADFHTIDAAHMMALVGTPEDKERWSNIALDLARNTSDERAAGWQGSLTNNLAWNYAEEERFDEALELFRENQAYWESKEKVRPTNIAKWSVARTLRSLGKVEEALAMQQALQSDWPADAGGPSGYVYEELGECLLELDRAEEAIPHFAQAFAMLGEDIWLKANEPERLKRLQELGQGQ